MELPLHLCLCLGQNLLHYHRSVEFFSWTVAMKVKELMLIIEVYWQERSWTHTWKVSKLSNNDRINPLIHLYMYFLKTCFSMTHAIRLMCYIHLLCFKSFYWNHAFNLNQKTTLQLQYHHDILNRTALASVTFGRLIYPNK